MNSCLNQVLFVYTYRLIGRYVWNVHFSFNEANVASEVYIFFFSLPLHNFHYHQSTQSKGQQAQTQSLCFLQSSTKPETNQNNIFWTMPKILSPIITHEPLISGASITTLDIYIIYISKFKPSCFPQIENKGEALLQVPHYFS